MKLSKIAVVGLAVLLLTAGAAAALPGDAPDFAGDDAQTDDHDRGDEHPVDRAGNASDASSNASSVSGQASSDAIRGPPVELPSAVPDHVSAIHDVIQQFLEGGLDGSLGDAVSDVTPDEERAED